MPDDLLVWSFFYWTVQRTPETSEYTYWNDQLRVGSAQAQTSLKLAIIELGRTLFDSTAYAARNRDNHGYVYDLFDETPLRFWRYQDDPEDVRRPVNVSEGDTSEKLA